MININESMININESMININESMININESMIEINESNDYFCVYNVCLQDVYPRCLCI